MTADLNIPKIKSFMHTLSSCHDIVRITGIWIKWNERTHTSNLEVRVDLMAFLYDHCTCDHLVMCRLVHSFFLIFVLRKQNSGIGPAKDIRGSITLVIDLIERHPVFYFIFVTLHDSHSKTYKEINDFAVDPSTVLFCKMIRHLEMTQGDDRFDAIFQKFVKHVIIKFQTFLIRFQFVTVWKNTGPRDTCAETFESHLCHQSDITLVFMIKINSFMVWIIFSLNHSVCDTAHFGAASAGHHINNARTFAAFVPSAFQLVCSNCSTP